MFTQIAHRYDLMNKLMTLGQDVRWRQEVVRRAALPPGGLLLDLGAGTGDLAYEAIYQVPDIQVIAADFTIKMMRVGKERLDQSASRLTNPLWTGSDALKLPFPNQVFDACISGFLLRNVTELDFCLTEQYRVLKQGGVIVSLDTTPPPKSPLAPVLRFHMHRIIPALGGLIARHQQAYTYLPASTEGFLEPERLAGRFLTAGFQKVGFRRLMLGTIAIHWGYKPRN